MNPSYSIHLEKLKECMEIEHLNPDKPVGKKAKNFAAGLPEICTSVLPEQKLHRSEVFSIASDLTVNTTTACAAVLAWGGMRPNHRKLLFENRDWLDVACDLRQANLDRKKAYERFEELRQQKKIKGMGPAYFTKLIYFLMPRYENPHTPGYIMDQWAGCSINLFTGQETVLMNVKGDWKGKGKRTDPTMRYDFFVSDENTCTNYEEFCKEMDSLVSHLGKDPEEVDQALVSERNKCWRKYVISNRPRIQWQCVQTCI